MKRLLLLLIFSGLFHAGNLFGQCIPDLSITGSGIYPDSATGLADGIVGQPYNQVIQARVPQDTTLTLAPLGTHNYHVVSVEVLSINGFPPGLTYNCTPSNCVYPGNSNGCMLISGIPTQAGTYWLTVKLRGTVSFLSVNIPQTDSVEYYHITINSATAIAQNNIPKNFSIEQNSPNPYNDFTSINYTVPCRSDIDFKIFNMIGKEVYHKQVNVEPGQNTLKLDGRDFSPGVYMYTMSCGSQTQTKRMVISRK